jgi:hypothetical protein
VDRDLVVIAIGLVVGTTTLHAANVASPRPASFDDEGRAWRAVLAPVLPLVAVTAAVAGWAVTDPDHDEALSPWTWCVAAAAVLVCLRAAWRAWRAATTLPDATLVYTRGLLSPRIYVDEQARELLDESAMAAALAHERAHVGGRDPLRIWVATIATDLQWPWPQPGRRFALWRHALEVARDDEARASGVRGADLAAAILAIASVQQSAPHGATAPLTDEDRQLQSRIARLLGDAPPRQRTPNRRGHFLAALGLTVLLGWAVGMLGGETALAWLARHGL